MRRQQRNFEVSFNVFSISIGLLLAVFLATTALYGLIKGFDNQKDKIAGESNFLGAAFCRPAAGQLFCRIHGAVGTPYLNSFGYPSCPACGQPMACKSIPGSPLSTVAAVG